MIQKKILNFSIAKDFLKTVGGDSAVDLVNVCERKNKPITDEEIAKEIGLKVTEVRTILNRLHYRGIAMYDKEKNKKTGWCNFTWVISQKRIAELLIEIQKEEMEKTEKKHDYEGTYLFFGCKKNCISIPFEIAAEYQFKCPECGEELKSLDGQKRQNDLSLKLETIKNDLKELEKFIE